MLWGILEGAARVLQALGSVYDAGAALVRRVRRVPMPATSSTSLPWKDVQRQQQQAAAGVAADKRGQKP